MKLIRRLVQVSVMLGIILVWYAAMSVYVVALQTDEVSADIAVVLGAAAWGNRPSPILRERINHAVQLYQRGDVHTIVFTGGKGIKSPYSEAEISANYARQLGVPESAIVLEDQSSNTIENLNNVRLLSEQYHYKTMLIVSTPVHQKRALFIAKQLGLTAYTSPTRSTRWVRSGTLPLFYVREVVANVHHRLLWPWLMPK